MPMVYQKDIIGRVYLSDRVIWCLLGEWHAARIVLVECEEQAKYFRRFRVDFVVFGDDVVWTNSGGYFCLSFWCDFGASNVTVCYQSWHWPMAQWSVSGSCLDCGSSPPPNWHYFGSRPSKYPYKTHLYRNRIYLFGCWTYEYFRECVQMGQWQIFRVRSWHSPWSWKIISDPHGFFHSSPWIPQLIPDFMPHAVVYHQARYLSTPWDSKAKTFEDQVFHWAWERSRGASRRASHFSPPVEPLI